MLTGVGGGMGSTTLTPPSVPLQVTQALELLGPMGLGSTFWLPCTAPGLYGRVVGACTPILVGIRAGSSALAIKSVRSGLLTLGSTFAFVRVDLRGGSVLRGLSGIARSTGGTQLSTTRSSFSASRRTS